jgi:hypothetical protein
MSLTLMYNEFFVIFNELIKILKPFSVLISISLNNDQQKLCVWGGSLNNI